MSLGYVSKVLGIVALFLLTGCTAQVPLRRLMLPPAKDYRAAKPLIELAKAHLGTRLGIPIEDIRVKGVEPLVFPWPAPGRREASYEPWFTDGEGFAIKLAVNNAAYEYSGRATDTVCVLWRER